MDQRHFDFDCDDEPHPAYRELDEKHQLLLINLMAALIISSLNPQEKDYETFDQQCENPR